MNDIEFLNKLSKFRILEHLFSECDIAVCDVNLSNVSYGLRQNILSITKVQVLEIGTVDFSIWVNGKLKGVTLYDLSSVYLAITQPRATMLISHEEDVMMAILGIEDVPFLTFDEVISKMVKDERIIELYKHIKAA